MGDENYSQVTKWIQVASGTYLIKKIIEFNNIMVTRRR
jgi:hypothetical protein